MTIGALSDPITSQAASINFQAGFSQPKSFYIIRSTWLSLTLYRTIVTKSYTKFYCSYFEKKISMRVEYREKYSVHG